MKHIIYLPFLLIFFSCEKKTEPTLQRYLDCYVRYLQAEDQMRAEATLRSGTSPANVKPADMPGGFQHNGQNMIKVTDQSGLYKRETAGTTGPTQSISWKNIAGEKQTFNQRIEPIQDFQFEAGAVTLGKAARLTWVGQPMETGENLLFLWDSPAHGTVTMRVSGATTGAALNIPAAEMDKLKKGAWTLYLVRKKAATQNIDGIEVRGLSEYYTKTINVKVQ